MDIRVLSYFLTVAREGNISAAAELLHMTQPPLSKQLKELEEELGKQLFIRGNRKITLTEEGMILRQRAEEMMELMEKTKSEISNTNLSLSGNVYIGTAESEGVYLISKTIKKMQRLYPNVLFHFTSGNAEEVVEKLEHGLLDFCIVVEPANMTNFNFLRLPTSETWGVLMRKDSPLAAKETITPTDLLSLPLLISRQTMVENEISGWLGQQYENLHIVATYNLLYNASIMVREGVGYALCLDNIVQTGEGSPFCFKPLSPILCSSLSIVWKKYQFFSPAAKKFLELLNKDF